MRSRLVALVAFLVLGVFMIVSCWIDMRHEIRRACHRMPSRFWVSFDCELDGWQLVISKRHEMDGGKPFIIMASFFVPRVDFRRAIN